MLYNMIIKLLMGQIPMKKSVYSIVLSDRVVSMVDSLAYREGMSRSAAINRTLSEYLSMDTPEQQIKQLLDEVVDRLSSSETLRIMPTLSGGLLSVRAPLRFKYNPTIKYSVELTIGANGADGEIRAAARTQSASLTAALDDFFSCFAASLQLPENAYRIESGRYFQRFSVGEPDNRHTAERISEYIKFLQSAMDAYFAQLPDLSEARRAVKTATLPYQRKL